MPDAKNCLALGGNSSDSSTQPNPRPYQQPPPRPQPQSRPQQEQEQAPKPPGPPSRPQGPPCLDEPGTNNTVTTTTATSNKYDYTSHEGKNPPKRQSIPGTDTGTYHFRGDDRDHDHDHDHDQDKTKQQSITWENVPINRSSAAIKGVSDKPPSTQTGSDNSGKKANSSAGNRQESFRWWGPGKKTSFVEETEIDSEVVDGGHDYDYGQGCIILDG